MSKKRFTAAAALMMVMGMAVSAHAAFDESLNDYTLDTMVVEADAVKNKFGDTITEQSYYRTGGDVKVITRDEIEKRHYVDMTDALKRIPGVTFRNPGYRGTEYGSNSYSNSIEINGDPHVIILVDGRRVDNIASTRFGTTSSRGSKGTADVNQVVNMEAVDKIEVIKGPGASVYGADATGGVINIITRKGGAENKGTIDIATGSWKRHLYNVSYSGSAGSDNSWHYFVSATRNMSSNSKYKDGITGDTHTYNGTNYKDENVNLRIDKDFNDKQSLKVWYNHQNEKTGYPITARDWRYWSQAGWDQTVLNTENGLFGDNKNPGYRNLFSLDALSGSYNANRNNDIDITFTFDKDNGMDSFLRIYNQKHHYWGRDVYPDWKTGEGFPGNANFNKFMSNYNFDLRPTRFNEEQNRGVQLQYGKGVGVNDLLFSVTYDKAKNEGHSKNRRTNLWSVSTSERESILGYIQDKIHINDKWDLTPSIRYSHYSSFETKNADGTSTSVDNSSNTNITPSINTQYAFDDTFSAYAGFTRVYRPVKATDYATDTVIGTKLQDEKGEVWTLGLRKDIGEKATVAAHYDWTKMSNAVTRYSAWNIARADFTTVYMNAKETKKSFNITADYKFDDHWNLGLAYTHLKDEWKAKDGIVLNPNIGLNSFSEVNAMINRLRPANHYTANLSYEKDKWYTGLLLNWYTGMTTEAFSSKRALVLDWNLNYKVNDDLTTYVSITNLTNEGYENDYYYYNGVGARPQPGRCIMVGMKYNF